MSSMVIVILTVCLFIDLLYEGFVKYTVRFIGDRKKDMNRVVEVAAHAQACDSR